MDPTPAVAVVIPTHDRLPLLQRAVASVLAQDVDLELLIVDDGSTDGTATWLAGLDDPRVRTWSIPNGGVAAARNLAIGAARAPWIALLDDDNEWLEGYLAAQLDTASAHPDAGLVYSASIERRLDRPDVVCPVLAPDASVVAELVRPWWPGISACVVRRDLLLEHPFRSDLPVSEDFEVWFDLAHRTPWAVTDAPLAVIYYHDGPRLSDGAARWAAAYEILDRELGATIRREVGSLAYARWYRHRVAEPHLIVLSEAVALEGRAAGVRTLRVFARRLPWSAPAMLRPAIASTLGPRAFLALGAVRRKLALR